MNNNSMAYHRPVLLSESIDALNIQPGGIYVDLTFGGGGHSLEVLQKLDKNGQLIAFDQDPDAAKNLPDDRRLLFIHANFRYLKHFLQYYKVPEVDGILADLGVSSHQIDRPERGFSFRSENALDMRMNPVADKSAVEVINGYSQEELIRVFREYGELRDAGRLARAIVEARAGKPIESSGELKGLLERFAPQHQQSKYMAKVYQAIRIEVNEELDALKEMLLQTPECLRTGGRLVVITYHSLEDRLVKNFMKASNLEGEVHKDFFGKPLSCWKIINRRVIVPGEEEIRTNNRARSAKLRVTEKI